MTQLLERSKNLVTMGIEAARTLLPKALENGRYPDHSLWILSHGFFNGFQSIIETLKNHEMNSGDDLLKEAIRDWLEQTRTERETRLGNWRNLMTHQGRMLTTLPTMEWVQDDWNDTVFPEPGHIFAEVGFHGDKWGITFQEWALNQFTWLDRGIREIEVCYNRLMRAKDRK